MDNFQNGQNQDPEQDAKNHGHRAQGDEAGHEHSEQLGEHPADQVADHVTGAASDAAHDAGNSAGQGHSPEQAAEHAREQHQGGQFGAPGQQHDGPQQGHPGQFGAPQQPGQFGAPGQQHDGPQQGHPGQFGAPGQPQQSGPGKFGAPQQPGQGQPGQFGAPGQPQQGGPQQGHPGQQSGPGQFGAPGRPQHGGPQQGHPGQQPGQGQHSGQPGPYGAPQQGGMPVYPAAGAAGQQMAAPQGAIPIPQNVNLASGLMLLGALMALIGGIVGLVSVGSTLNNSGLDSDAAGVATAAGVGGGIVSMIISIGLWVWMALAHRMGQGWARIVATVLAAINIISQLVSLFTGRGAGVVIVGIIYLLVSIAALIVMWMKPNTEYIKAKTAQRMAKRPMMGQ